MIPSNMPIRRNGRLAAPRKLGSGYDARVDSIDELSWYRLIEQFSDVNIFQAWAYDELRAGRGNISHLVLTREGELVAAAQARLVTLPFISFGVAFVRWGPLWHRADQVVDLEVLRQAVRALRNEYVCRRGLVLRIQPYAFKDDSADLVEVLEEEGLSSRGELPGGRTLVLDLSAELNTLRERVRPHWLRELKVAEKRNLDIVEGSDPQLFDSFLAMHAEMAARKGLTEPADLRTFRLAQERLPGWLKMRVMIGKTAGELSAGLVCSAIGQTAIYLFGATTNAGLKSRGSYLLQWKLIEWLKQNDVLNYDLNGINPETNAGTYKFKADLCGENGRDVVFVGQFDSYRGIASRACLRSFEALRGAYREVQRTRPAGVGAALNHLRSTVRAR